MMAFSNQLRNMAGALAMLFLAIGLNHGSAWAQGRSVSGSVKDCLFFTSGAAAERPRGGLWGWPLLVKKKKK